MPILLKCSNNWEKTLFFNNKKLIKNTLLMKSTVKLKFTNTTEELISLLTKSLNLLKKFQLSVPRLLNSNKTLKTKKFNLISSTNKKLNLLNKENKMLNPSRNSIMKPNKLLKLLMLSSQNSVPSPLMPKFLLFLLN